MGREVRRVPLDFDWPADEVWRGFLMPEELHPETCGACGGNGLGRETARIEADFYDFERRGTRWCDAVTQDEVDALVEHGRLMGLTHDRVGPDGLPAMSRETLEARLGRDARHLDDWIGNGVVEGTPDGLLRMVRGWIPKDPPHRPTAAEVNAMNRRPGLHGHDAINRWILVETRARRLGVWGRCAVCGGEGHIFRDDAHRAAHDAWGPTPPPEGDGWQVWETVSEGSPVSPVLATADALVEWLCGAGHSEEAARAFVGDGWAPSFVIEGGRVREGIDSRGGDGDADPVDEPEVAEAAGRRGARASGDGNA